MIYAEQMRRHRTAIAAVFQLAAATCEQDAEGGVFHPIGQRCAWCLHSVPNGCRLRLLKEKAPS